MFGFRSSLLAERFSNRVTNARFLRLILLTDYVCFSKKFDQSFIDVLWIIKTKVMAES
jgi:hypothetical protein